MFGISAFAQSPFASLGMNAYVLSITEDVNLADSNAQASAFLQSITEPITLTDLNSQGVIFIGTVSEEVGLADSPSISSI